MHGKILGYVYLALCIIFWASFPVASKKVLAELDNLQMIFYSTVFSLIALGLILLVQEKHKVLNQYSRKDYLSMALSGFLGAYLYYVLLYKALTLTTAQEGFILAYTWPILVLIFAFVILKEQLTLKKISAILISFFGIVIIVTHGKLLSLAATNILGDILALSGAFVFAMFSVFGKKHNFDKTISAFVYFLSALIFSAVSMFIFSSPKIPSPSTWIWLLYNGILVNGVTYIWWFQALEKVDTSIVSTSLYLTPFVSLIYIWVFLDEKILFTSIIGLIVIVAGVLVQYYNRESESA